MFFKQRFHGKFGLGLLIGTIGGAVAGIFMKDRFDRSEIKGKAMKIFGDMKEESMRLYTRATEDLHDRMDNFKESVGKIDREKYQKLVSEVIDDLKETTSASADRLNKLKDYLMKDVEKIFKKR